MKKQIIKTELAQSSPLWSQGVRIGSTIYVGGMAGWNPATKQMAGPTIQDQTRQALNNAKAVIEAGGGTIDGVVMVTVLLANPKDWEGFNEEYAKFFPTDPPPRAVGRLGPELPGLLVSVMMTAHVDG